MAESVEFMFFAAACHGIAFHEIACGGYFILAKAIEDPKQVKKFLFLLCVLTFSFLTIQTSMLTAILHWIAAGSKAPFPVQDEWFKNVGATSSNMYAISYS